jgi:hypothetical protein
MKDHGQNLSESQFKDVKSALVKEIRKRLEEQGILSSAISISLLGKLVELFQSLLEKERGITPDVLYEILFETANLPKTFAIPSHPIMFTLLALFAGKPERIPRRLLEKPYSKRSPEEQKEADEFLMAIFDKETKVSYTGEGKEVQEEKRIAFVCNNPRIEAKARISENLWGKDLAFREEALAVYIRRTFGAEGLRHLLGLIIGLEENFRQGFFEWSLNEHLERLGYRMKKHRSYDTQEKKDATEILKIFTDLFLTVSQKDGKGRERIQGERLFSIDGFKIDTFNKEVIDERLKIRATDFWYKNAFEPKDNQAPMYTKLLKKIAQENHRNHPLTIYLAPLFAIWWRMNPSQKITVKNLMDWCDLNTKDRHKLEHIRDLEAELNYMKEAGYLGSWTSSGEAPSPSECKDSLECVLTVTPPEWLSEEIKLISDKKELLALPQRQEPQAPLIMKDELERLLNNSGQTINQFANNLGVSRQMVSYIIHGKRKMTQRVSDKVREVFGHMLPV